MSKPNIILVIVDCLRYSHALKMPFLRQLGQELPGGYWFENHWATSHCTDPCMMHMLTGKHPDELRLYSMMFGDPGYVAPDVPTFFKTANEHGYHTSFITNIQRWYDRDVTEFIDSRSKGIEFPWKEARRVLENSEKPLLLVLHTDDCHKNYTFGSYAAACGFTDQKLKELYDICPKNTVFIVTADHGEGLGQAGLDGKPIDQHGYGLADFLTHIPLVVNIKNGRNKPFANLGLTDHGYTHRLTEWLITEEGWPSYNQDLVFQAGATPKVFHRGVVDSFGRQFVRASYRDGSSETYTVPVGYETMALELELKEHCAKYGIDYGEIEGEAALIERLKGLGYWAK